MIFTLFLITGALVMGQTVQISGTVTSSEDGLALPGVNVTVKGTTIGAITGADGKYTISVPASAKALTFSFIGFRTQEIPIRARHLSMQISNRTSLMLKKSLSLPMVPSKNVMSQVPYASVNIGCYQ